MSHQTFIRTVSGLCLATLLAACGLWASGPTAPETRLATLKEVVNRVESRPGASQPWAQASIGSTLEVGGQVQTYDTSTARLDIDGGTIVRVGPMTLFTFSELEEGVAAPVDELILEIGKVFVVLAEDFAGDFEIQTPVGTAAVRGSIISVAYNPALGSMVAACFIGDCALADLAGQETALVANTEAEIPSLGAPPSEARPLSIGNLQDFLQMPEADAVLPTLQPTLGALPEFPVDATPVFPTAAPPNAPTPVITSISPFDLVYPTPTSTPELPDGGQGGGTTGGQVTLPPLSCSTAAECEAYCGDGPEGQESQDSGQPGTPLPPAGPNEAECQAFLDSLVSQGVDFQGFLDCVYAGGDFQSCADKNFKPQP